MTETTDAVTHQQDAWTELRESRPALAYLIAYPLLRRIAREHGYALALHGSLARDFDLIAVPWTTEASDADTLVRAICDGTELIVTVPDRGDKPHGRRCWTLQSGALMRRGWVDLAVMPRSLPTGTEP